MDPYNHFHIFPMSHAINNRSNKQSHTRARARARLNFVRAAWSKRRPEGNSTVLRGFFTSINRLAAIFFLSTPRETNYRDRAHKFTGDRGAHTRNRRINLRAAYSIIWSTCACKHRFLARRRWDILAVAALSLLRARVASANKFVSTAVLDHTY